MELSADLVATYSALLTLAAIGFTAWAVRRASRRARFSRELARAWCVRAQALKAECELVRKERDALRAQLSTTTTGADSVSEGS